MKTFFLLFAFCLSTYAYTQTTREEVVERFVDGSKKKVITYSGVGNAEKILKVTYYDNWLETGHYVSPYYIQTYGSKVVRGQAFWGVVKTQHFKAGGSDEDSTELTP